MRAEKNSPSDLRFLVATDVHLGHSENHHELGNDSYSAFEEVLQIAHQKDVDFVLLGGDLFDEVNPTQKCIFKCLNLLRNSIFGDRELTIGVQGMQCNFTNRNLNIRLPVFTIHGNHDYPSNDFGKISVCDLLHASNYVNYFGKNLGYFAEQGNPNKNILIKPLIFSKKGLSGKFLALYGLGYIKDFKLHKMMMEGQVNFVEPPDLPNTTCIFILHQNRYNKKGGVGASFENCIHPDRFPKWISLVIWGHEHEAIPTVENQAHLRIFQPGSTVITSYIEAEAKRKQCVVITISANKEIELQPIPLSKSYRPLFVKSYSIREIVRSKRNADAQQSRRGEEGFDPFEADQRAAKLIDFEAYFENELSRLLEDNRRNQIEENSRKPIIRIKVDYTGFEIIRLIRVEEKFKDLVANSNKIFQYSQTKKKVKGSNKGGLDDKEVLDMIKLRHTNRDHTGSGELTEEIMDIFQEELMKTPLQFFEMEKMKEKVAECASIDAKIPLSAIKTFYAKELEGKVSALKKDIGEFMLKEDGNFKKMQETLMSTTEKNLKGRSSMLSINASLFEAEIFRYKQSHVTKEAEILSAFSAPKHSSKNLHNSRASETISPFQPTSTIVKIEDFRFKDDARRSTSKPQTILIVSSDEEDCCRRAEKSEYMEQHVAENFRKAEGLVHAEEKKKKKNVTFHDFK